MDPLERATENESLPDAEPDIASSACSGAYKGSIARDPAGSDPRPCPVYTPGRSIRDTHFITVVDLGYPRGDELKRRQELGFVAIAAHQFQNAWGVMASEQIERRSQSL